MSPLAGRRPGARRIAASLLERGGEALAAGVRVVTGRGDAASPALAEPPGADATNHDAAAERAADATQRAAAEEAAARLDAARERLRARIPAPDDEEPPQAAP